MKHLLCDNGGYEMYVELSDYLRSNGNLVLKFTSKYQDSKNPDDEQVRFQIILTEEQRKVLKSIL